MFVLGIGWATKRSMSTNTDFFLSGHSIFAWITKLAFISVNFKGVNANKRKFMKFSKGQGGESLKQGPGHSRKL
jgi:hypothetical protein